MSPRPPLLSAIAALLHVACAGPSPIGEDARSCEIPLNAENSAPGPAVDVVIVVSDAPTMAPYRDALIANLAALGDAATMFDHGPLLHLAVVGDDSGRFTTAPRLDGCAVPTADYLVDLEQPWFECPGEDGCKARNYDGLLADAVACIGAVPPDGAPTTPLLARLEQALGPRNPASAAFLRPDAWLLVILISAEDDGSPDDATAYARRLRDQRADRGPVLVVTVGPAPDDAPRLGAFRDAVGAHPSGNASAIAAAEWRAPLDALWATDFTDLMLAGCIHDGQLIDAVPTMAGLQFDCVASEQDAPGRVGAPIPACVMASPERPAADTPLPCLRWREPVAWERDQGCVQMAIIERAARPHPRGDLQCACE